MLQTVKAVIDPQGRVRLLEIIKPGKKRRALVTILDEEEISASNQSVVGSIELLDDDLENGSHQLVRTFNESLDESAEKLND